MRSYAIVAEEHSEQPPHNDKQSGRNRRVVFCTNLIAPYRSAPLRALTNALQSFTVLVSTLIEDGRPWKPDLSGLNIIRQRSISFTTHRSHPFGFKDTQTVNIPYDALFWLHRLRPDVVISNEMGPRSVLSALYCAAVPSCRLIIWADYSESSEKGRGAVRVRIRRWLIRRAAAIIVNGTGGRRYIETLGASTERIHVVPYTTDCELFMGCAISKQRAERRRLLYLGQLIPRKGILTFLSVCVRWCQEHQSGSLDFLIVGDGELWDVLESFQSPKNMFVRLEHSVQYSQIAEVYQRAGVFVLPTLADTWALVVNEALAAGLPVLGSVHSQAVDEMVVDGINGWRYRGDDIEDAYRALCKVMDSSEDQLAAMGKHAREKAVSIGPEHFAKCVANVIESVFH